jgi:ketosteroid isomerase-like protein
MKTLALILFIFLLSCGNTIDIEQVKKELIKADEEFSKLSVDKGKNHAFLSYLDNEGVILRGNGLPLEGKSAIAKLYENQPDTSYTLKWKPQHATASKSGDLGYTYGVWQYNNKDTLIWGTYVTIWKKDENGKWKFVLDSGNTGLGDDAEKIKEQF